MSPKMTTPPPSTGKNYFRNKEGGNVLKENTLTPMLSRYEKKIQIILTEQLIGKKFGLFR